MDAQKIRWSLDAIRIAAVHPGNLESFIEGGFFTLLEKCFTKADVQVKTTALWTICSIAYGEVKQTNHVIQFLPKIARLLGEDFTGPDVHAQGVSCLAIVASDSVDHRDRVLESISMSVLYDIQRRYAQPSVLENLAWLIGNIVRHGPHSGGLRLRDVSIEILNGIMEHHDVCDCAVISAVCWALQHVLHSLGEEDTLEAIETSEIVGRIIVHGMDFPEDMECRRTCFVQMLKLIANLLSSDDDDICQSFIDQGVLKILSIVMNEELCELYYHTCFAIANIFACSSVQIQRAIEHDLLTAAIHQLEHGNIRAQKEATIALSNFLENAQPPQVLEAYNRGLVAPFVQQLRGPDFQMIYDTLVSLINLLRHADQLERTQEWLDEMIDCGLKEHVQKLKCLDEQHEQIGELARNFWRTFLTDKFDDISTGNENCEIEGHYD